MKTTLNPLVILLPVLLVGAVGRLSAEANPRSAAETRVRADIAQSAEKRAAVFDRFAYYTVPAMSNVKRTMDTYPVDGTLAAPVRIVAAKGEFEPASVVLYPFSDAAKVELKVSDLVGKNGKLPGASIDVKVVKVWYQGGTAWYSYFADSSGRQLVPELLLNDENLLKVDRKTKDNYLRVDYPKPNGTEYVWISNTKRIDAPFNDHKEPVADAPTFQPFTFEAGSFKQLWFTFEAPKTAEGIYTGTISITVDGKQQGAIPLEVRVLPFELPDPKTNYDLSREYYTSTYNSNHLGHYLEKNGSDWGKAKDRLLLEYVNMRKHNMLYPMIPEYKDSEAVQTAQLELYKKAGLHTDAIFGSVPAVPSYDWMTSPEVKNSLIENQVIPEDFLQRLDRGFEITTKVLGPTTIYCFGWDEPAMNIVTAQRKVWKYLADKGLKVYSTGHATHLLYGGYNEDFLNSGGGYSRESAAQWHAIGARITNYATPHTGPENPDFVRRTHGLDNYKEDSDGTNNYILNGSSWNDFLGEDYNFRSFNWVYPGQNAPIDTIQWEGYREAIDDVRYATLLKQAANRAIATGKTEQIYAGRMALQWLVLLDAKQCDLNAARLEMISYILKLSDNR